MARASVNTEKEEKRKKITKMRWQTVWSVKAARITTIFFRKRTPERVKRSSGIATISVANNKPSNSNSETIYEGCFIATLFARIEVHNFQM